MSRETSFVALERRETPVLGGVTLRRVPIAVTTGWGGSDQRDFLRGSRIARRLSLGDTDEMLCALEYRMPQSVRESRPSSIGRTWFDRLVDSAAGHVPHGDAAAPPPMHALVALQRADGSWELSRELADAIGHDLTGLEAALRGATGEEVRRAWATALAIAWLEARAPQARGEWRLLAAKARKWLDRVQARPPAGGRWIDAAAALLHEAPA